MNTILPKKQRSAASLTNKMTASFLRMAYGSIFALLLLMSGGVFGQGTITINLTSAGGTSNLGSTNYNSGAERTWTQSSVTFGGKAITSNGSDIQVQAANGVFYNTTPLPGKILSIVLNQTGTARNYNCFGGNTSRLVNSTSNNYTVSGGTAVGSSSTTGWTSTDFSSTNYTYFAFKEVSGTSYITSIVITYETAACTGTPTPGNTIASSTSVVSGGTTDLSLQSATTGSGVTYQWQQSADNSSWSNIVGANNASYTATVATKTFYKCTVTCGINSADSSSIEVNLVYCNSSGTTSFETGTTNVKFNTIDNSSTSMTPGYNDYTSISTTVQAGSSYSISAKVNSAGDYTVYTKVWIDWNQNLIFDASEEYNLGTAKNVINGATTLSGLSVSVPSGATLGNTRMRISTKYFSAATSCEATFDGEVEDYTINVVAAVSTVLANNGSAIAAGNITQGTNGNIISSFTLTPAGGAAMLSTVTVPTTGNYVAADINGSGFKLWYNTTNTFGSAIELKAVASAAAGTGETLSFSGLTQALTSGATSYFWVTSNIIVTATPGNTIIAGALATSNITMAAGTKSGSSSASGTKTIIVTAVPTISVTPITLTDFGSTCIGLDATKQTYAVTAVNLTNDITVTAPAGFKVRKGGDAYADTATLVKDGSGNVSMNVDVIYRPTAVGASGTLTITNVSSGAVTKNVSVSGTGNGGAVTVATVTPTIITTTTANPGGNSLGTTCGTITAKGVVWGTSANPTVPSVNSTSDGTGTAPYSSSLTGLSANTTYNYRAYATNSNGVTSYGNNNTFKTLKTEPTNHPTSFACGTTTTTTIPLTWIDATGASVPDGYLIKWSTSYGAITAPVDGTAETDASTVKNVLGGVQTFTPSGLTSSTTYFFKIWSYNNNGTSIDYKLTGEAQTSCSTLSGPCFEEVFTGFSGDDTTTTGSSANWTGNSNFPNIGNSNTYQAGNAIRLGTGSSTGKVTSKILTSVSGDITVSLDVKGWTSVEGDIVVNINTVTTNISYTATVGSSYQTKTVNFTGVPSGSILTISTSAKRAFIKNIQVFCAPVVSPVVTAATVTGSVGTALSYSILASNSPTSYAVASGILPAGLSLNTTSGVISGTPTAISSAVVGVTATNSAGTSAPADLTFAIAKGNQTITFADINKNYGDANFTLGGSASSGLTVTYVSSNTSVATISGTTVTILAVGTTNITASQAGDANWNAAADNVKILTVGKKALSITGLSVTNKVYDGTSAATLSGTAVLNGVINSDVVSLSAPSAATFNTKNVGTGKAVTVTYTLSGANAGNYTLTQPALTGTITAKALTITGAAAQNKTYDGTTAALITGATLVGVIAPDVVTVGGGGTFANANVGTAKVVTASLTLSGAGASNYTVTQPTGLTANITAAVPVFTTSTITLSVAGTYSLPGANVTSTSAGALSYAITGGGNATLSGSTLTGVAAGSETLTVNQAANGNYSAGSTTVTVNVVSVVYVVGDFKSTYDGTGLSYSTGWQYYNGSGWVAVPDGKGPESTTTTISTVYIDHEVDGGGNATKNYNCNFVISSGGKLTLNDFETVPSTFIAASKKLEVLAGGELTINADMGVNSSGNLIVKSGGSMVINSSTATNDHPMWNGNENFEGGSTVTINDWKWTASPGSRSLVNTTVAIKNNTAGYKFGNLIIDVNSTDSFVLVGGGIGVLKLCENNLDISNSSSNFIHGASNASTAGFEIGGNMTIYDGSFSFGANFADGTFNHQFIINGIFECASNDALKINYRQAGNSTFNSDSRVTFRGNVTIGSAVTSFTNESNTPSRMNVILEGGTELSPAFISISPTAVAVPFTINTGYRKLQDQDLSVNSVSGYTSPFIVKSGAILDFGFGSTNTSLNIVASAGAVGTNSFEAEAGSILKITSPSGIRILADGAFGNVQTAIRTFGLANYHYVGKLNQITGSALPTTVASLTINNETLTNDVTLTQAVKVSGTLALTSGNIVSTDSNLLELGTGASVKGTLAASPAGFVKGPMKRWFSGTNSGNGSGLFPLGTSDNKNRFAALEYTTAPSTAGAVTAKIEPSAMGVIGLTPIPPSVDVIGACPAFSVLSTDDMYWSMTSTDLVDGVYSATLQKESASALDICKQTILKGSATSWGVSGTQVAPGGSAGNITLKRTGLTGITHLGIGRGFCNSSTLTYNSASDWTNTPPTLLDKIEITGDYTIPVGTTVSACECTVAAGKTLTISSGATFVVAEGVTINTGGFIDIKNTGSLVQSTNVDNELTNNNIGLIKMERITPLMWRYDFTYWSSPVINFPLKSVSPLTLFDKFFSWDAVVQAWEVHKSNLAPADLKKMESGRGYTVRAPQWFDVSTQSGGEKKPHTANFIGVPNNGTVKQSIAISDDNNVSKWNLIGNPYPSALDAKKFLKANSNLDGTLYFWTHNTSASNGGSGAYYSYNSADYVSWNVVGSTTGCSGCTSPSGKIGAGQSFFVKGIGNSATIARFTNAMREAGTNNQFFKSAAEENPEVAERHRIWLNLQGATTGFNQTLIGYLDDATNGLDSQFDGDSFGGNQVTLYSVLDTKKLVIQGRALPFSVQDEVPLGYKTTLTGNLTISIDHKDGLLENQAVYLRDNVLNVTHNLTTSNYVFASVPGTFDSRFVLRYLPQEDLANPTFADKIQGVTIRKNNADLHVNSPYELIDVVSVYDITGRLVFEKKQCNTNVFTTSHIVGNDQTLIVKVQLVNGGVVTGKVY